MATLVKLKCINCGKDFKVKKGREKKTCSNDCRLEYRRKKDEKYYVEKICEYCEKSFKSKKKENKKTCSYKCMGLLKSKKSKIIENCLNCGKSFTRLKSEDKKICSEECRKIWNSKPENIKKRINASKRVIKEKYGVESVLELESIRKKVYKTKKENLKENPDYYNEIYEKVKESKKIKYGDGNYNNYEKIYNTKLDKYGDGNFNNRELFHDTINKKLSERLAKNGYKLLNVDGDTLTIKHGDGHIFNTFRTLAIIRLNENIELSTEILPHSPSISNYELEINDFLVEHNIKVETNNRNSIKPYELDLFLPDYSIAIELNGLYWHSELHKSNNYHINKTKLCEENNINLIHIFEDEWVNKKEIVKSMLKSKLGLITNKIFARKCTIREIGSIEYKEFLNENHLMGAVNSKYKIGLFYDNALVAVMGFEKLRKTLGNYENNESYNLNRFAVKTNYNIIGGASKLLKFFIRNYDPVKITSYSDKRYSQGELYIKLGFKHIHLTKPNYWYVDYRGIVRMHRFNFRKNKLVKMGYDENKTEHEIMLNNKIPRIYDCGNDKYELTIKKPLKS